ncbi:monocarboxylate transporter 9-like [Palaemon carinicauda]|uniref:monocarboxylate transporter 9-like n=1 Tax=Palaemon carinicauda TaxID=392227 RepID=UPI0035B5EA5B
MMTAISQSTTPDKASTEEDVHDTPSQVTEENEARDKLLPESSKRKMAIDLGETVEGELLRPRRTTKGVSSSELVPPDGGWGWLVATGSFINILLVCSVVPCFSIAFFYILVGFETSTTTIGWIISIHSFLWNMAGPFTMPLVMEFGWRRVGAMGVLMMSVAYAISAFTPSAEFLFFSFSFLSGVGCGISATIAFNIVPQYFLRRRGISNGFIMAGISVGQILGPPFVRFLQDGYSSKGALLILAAVSLNGLVGGCFFHPVAWHMKYAPEKRKPTVTKRTLAESTTEKSSFSSNRKRISQIENSRSHISSNTTRLSMYASTISIEAGVSVQSFPVFKEEEGEGKFEPSGRRNSFLETVVRLIKSLISDMKVMRSRRAILINMGISFMIVSHVNFCMLMPFSIQALGHSLQDASYAVSIMGTSSLTARLIISPMTDCAWFNMRICYMTGYAVVSCVILVFPFIEDLKWIYVVMSCYGATVGMNISLNNLVIIKFMGLEKLPAVFGTSQVFTGIGFLAAGPFIGLIRDVTQSYAIAIWILSFFVLCSFLIWFLMPAAIEYDLKREAKQKQTRSGKVLSSLS